MLVYEDVLRIEPYSLSKKQKEKIMLEELNELTKYHMEHCDTYRTMLNKVGFLLEEVKGVEDIPFLPVRLFKELDLCSIDEKDIFKVMTSSGTTGQKVSKIYLDRETAANQQKTLIKIVSSFTGKSRLPLLIIDCPSVVKNRAMFSARGAGILGFSIIASERQYALDDNMNIDIQGIKMFLDKYKGQPILVFGFTFMIWQYFYVVLKQQGIKIDISQGILIHGGGWKKLFKEAVSTKAFDAGIKEVCEISRIHDYYGMIEQTGCIYMQCECGNLHASVFSDIIIRKHTDFSVCSVGERGMIQVVSLLPKSYPGHSILTEDEGVLLGIDDCPCGRLGKYFKVIGRIKNAEIRGCSDTYEQE